MLKRDFSKLQPLIYLLPLALAAVILAPGCSSPHSKYSNRMASIVVTNRTSENIDAAVRSVFEKHQYQEGKSDDEDVLIFEKQGSFLSGMVYSDWYSGGVWERIRVYQRDLKADQIVLECDGYMVKQHDDPLFAEEKPEYKTKRGHCQKLLDEVAVELVTMSFTNSPPPAKMPDTNAPPAK